MKHNYLLPMARNLRTGQTVKQQDLAGVRYSRNQLAECQHLADRLAAQLGQRTGDPWEGFCEPYTPTHRH